MNEKNYLSEEKYNKHKNMLITVATLVLLLGIAIGGILVANGIQRVTNNYKQDELLTEKTKLEAEKARLEAEGIKYSVFSKYTDGKKYDLKVIVDALDPSFDHCSNGDCQNHVLTANYCKIKTSNGMSGMIFVLPGIFILFVSIMISVSIFAKAKGREIAAFNAQQVMPIAKEGIEEIAPSLGTAAREISKGFKDGYK